MSKLSCLWIVFVGLHGVSSKACECAARSNSVSEELKARLSVFLGKVENSRSIPSENVTVYEIRPSRVWKGSVNEVETLRVRGGKTCGYPFQTGKSYLIYSNDNELNPVSTCSRTRLETEAGSDLKALGPSLCQFELSLGIRNAKHAATKYFKRDFANYPPTHILISCEKDVASVVFRSKNIAVEELKHTHDGIDAQVVLNPGTGAALQVMLGP